MLPNWVELAGWGGVLGASLVFVGCGRLLSRGRAPPEIALVIGWGFACFVLTLWGVAVAAPLTLPAAAVVIVGLMGFLPAVAPRGADWRALARLIAVAAPLLLVMASARPSLPDTFLNLLPNAAYLYDHAAFPADGAAPAHSLLPGAPYNLQLAAFIAGLASPEFPYNAMIAFNIVLQLAAALLLARLVEGGDRFEESTRRAPSWAAAALGLLLATLLNPGFVARYDLSAYSEPSVTVATAVSGWLAARATAARAEGRRAGDDLLLLALSLVALVNIKQDSVALAVGVVAAAAVLALPSAGRLRRVLALAAAAAPAALLYLAWRWYVLSHFAAGELKLLPFREWQFALIPQILLSMAGTLVEKAYFSLAVIAALVVLARRRRRGLDFANRVAAVFGGVFFVYNGALFFTYIAHFDHAIGASAHSYFRYNTHLGLLLVASLTLFARQAIAARDAAARERWRRAGGKAAVALALASPLLFFGFLRFDLEPTQVRAWVLADQARAALARDPRLAVVLPGDDGSLETMLEGLIRFTPPRHRDATLSYMRTLPPTIEEAARGFPRVLLSCAPPGQGWAPPGQGALITLDPPDAMLWTYPPDPWPIYPSRVLPEASLCL